ncbi:MAG: 50S ribosomal protein L18 [archaeon]
MAQGPRYRVMFRRRRKGKTDYTARLGMLRGNLPRFVVRSTNSRILCQLVDYSKEGDKTTASVGSDALKQYGWKAGGANTSAAYLTGLLLGKKSGAKKAILDIGLSTSVKGAKVYAAAKGLQDAGVEIAIGDVVPDESRISGTHVQEYAKSLPEEERKKRFSLYYKNSIDPTKLVDHFNAVKVKIEGAK